MKSVDRAPTCEFNPGTCLTTEEKARKNLSQGSQGMLLPITKTPTQLQYPPYTHPQYYQKPHTSIQYKTHTYTNPYITKLYKTTTVQYVAQQYRERIVVL